MTRQQMLAKLKLALARVKTEVTDLLTALNTVGSILLEYAMQNQDIADRLLPLVPLHLRPTIGPLLPPIWWLVVQVAKARAIKKAQNS